MPQATEVKASKWKDVEVLFDNGVHSVICGYYTSPSWPEGSLQLGSRWNGENGDVGYPKLFGNPVFYVIPAGLEMGILNHLPNLLHSDKELLVGDVEVYRSRIHKALVMFSGIELRKGLTTPN